MKKLFLILSLLLIIPSLSFSQSYDKYNSLDKPSDYRFYDDKGRYEGKAEYTPYGRYRLYDKDGKYKGYAEPRPYGATRIYDEKGNYKGKTERKK
jgi:hypothetical protein